MYAPAVPTHKRGRVSVQDTPVSVRAHFADARAWALCFPRFLVPAQWAFALNNAAFTSAIGRWKPAEDGVLRAARLFG